MTEAKQAKSAGHARFLEQQSQRIGRIREELQERYPDPAALTLEIGCGHGHYLTAYAGQHPESTCLGVDIVSKRIRKAILKRDKRKLQNLHFLKAEIREFLAAWPAHLRLARVFILFPDPWPKKRHRKNRILQPALLDRLAGLAEPAAQLHFRTDHEGNFQWGLETVASHPCWEVRDDLEWPFENPTWFQDLLGKGFSLTAALTNAEGKCR